ncbi:hypothetical protein [Mycobacteroides abscessus]|uniref:hypothetical protein n=1 Tax=Mycobacteroides abscessus TaxID=36809 RepID=UPI0020C51A13|nr:hypothetical protein [Mycobacteroides abscessus]
MITNNEGSPYLRRWYVIPRNRWVNIYVHQFLRSDDDRAMHDHPWPFFSWVLKGRYFEEIDLGVIVRERWSFAYRPAVHRHIVRLDVTMVQDRYEDDSWARSASPQDIPVWTLIVTGRRMREWGFWCPDPKTLVERFVPWREFGARGCE